MPDSQGVPVVLEKMPVIRKEARMGRKGTEKKTVPVKSVEKVL